MSEHVFKLDQAEYWDNPRKTISDFAWERMQAGGEGLFIDGPEFVPMDNRATIPLIIYSQRDKKVLSDTPIKGCAFVVAVSLETQAFFVAPALTAPDRKKNANPSPGLAGQDFVVDLRKVLGIPWEISTFSVRLIHRNLISNQIVVGLSETEAAFGSSKEKKLLNEKHERIPCRNAGVIGPSRELIQEILQKEGRSGLNETGILIEPRQQENKFADIVPVHVSYFLPTRKEDTINDEIGNPAGTVVPVHVFVTATSGEFWYTTVHAPSEIVELNGDTRQFGSGTFSVDVKKVFGLNVPDSLTAYIYVFHGNLMDGPSIVKFKGE